MTRRAPHVSEESAADVLKHHFGKRPRQVKRLHGGLVNHVFEAKVGREFFVVRISDDLASLQSFMKEQWAVCQARKQRVPAPEILEVGNTAINAPYMICVKLSGRDATAWPDRLNVAREMGQYAARINSIRTSGFGAVFDWSPNQLSRNTSWSQFIDGEFKLEARLQLLESQRMLKPSDLRKLVRAAKSLRSWRGRPALTHGDLRFKNVVLDDKGKIGGILDWENASSNIAPHWELSIALHDLNIDEKEAFLEGYGLTPKKLAALQPELKALNILNYTPSIEHAIRQKNRKQLDYLRARLHGALDLHSI